MVTLIVVLILIAVVITFAVLLIIKKGKLAKKWFISFGGVVLAGIICIAVAVPVTSNKVADEVEEYEIFYWEMRTRLHTLPSGGEQVVQEYLKEHYETYNEETEDKIAWLKEWQERISTGVWWDLNSEVKESLLSLKDIPYVYCTNGYYKPWVY